MSNFTRSIINALLPPGPKWNPSTGLDFDLWLNGLSESFDDNLLFLEQLALLRDPRLTPNLEDLEREYGITTKTNLSESVRRENLNVKIYSRGGTGSKDNLQDSLERAGFMVQVHENSPAVDPSLFLDQAFQLTLGDTNNAYIGDPNAYLGRIGGELLVNGAVFTQRPIYLSELNGQNAYIGDPLMGLGYFTELYKEKQEFPIPTDPDSWPFIFFVGGDATRDGTGALTNIEQADIESEKREEFENIILAYKPMHSWAGLIISYI